VDSRNACRGHERQARRYVNSSRDLETSARPPTAASDWAERTGGLASAGSSGHRQSSWRCPR
jgi:hypothetical protein